MFKNILLPLDGSQIAASAVAHAMALAGQMDSKITVLHVLEDNRDPHRNVDPMEWHMRKAAATINIEKMANWLRPYAAEVEVAILSGAPVDRIVEFADQSDTDLVILTRHGCGGMINRDQESSLASDSGVGGEARKIMDQVGRSILLVNPGHASHQETDASVEPYQYHNILAPLDGSPRAECVLPIVQSLALKHHALVTVANVVPRPWMASPMPLTEEDRELMTKLMARAQARAEQYLSNVCAHLEPERRVRLRTGNSIAEELHGIVAQESIDLVISSAHGATSDHLRPYGTIASSFISYASSHVLIFQDCPPVRTKTRRTRIASDEVKNLNQIVRSYA